jgi:hypothetical protein
LDIDIRCPYEEEEKNAPTDLNVMFERIVAAGRDAGTRTDSLLEEAQAEARAANQQLLGL